VEVDGFDAETRADCSEGKRRVYTLVGAHLPAGYD
jgi:hypothetical protein